MTREVIPVYSTCNSFFDRRVRVVFGRKSEQTVEYALKKLPDVKNVETTVQGSGPDFQGVDLVVSLRSNGNRTCLDTVHVQVKSGLGRVKTFFNNIKQEHQLDDDQAMVWLLKNRMIIINGTVSPKDIQKSFNLQIKQISEYHQQRGEANIDFTH